MILSANLDGVDLGPAISQVGEVAAATLPPGFSTSLAGESREFVRGSQGLSITFLLALAAVFLVLAAQFESFVHPFTIMLALPLATFGALAGLAAFGMTLNIYSFIGLIIFPVALGLGAGSESRRPLGVAVLIGMSTSTLLTLFVVPVF